MAKRANGKDKKPPPAPKLKRGERINTARNEDVRAKIQTSQIVNRLNGFVLGAKEYIPGSKKMRVIEMTDGQLRAAIALLKKVLPDLVSAELKLDAQVQYVARMPQQPQDAEEWQKQHSPTPTIQ